jgi:biopolymer transport protein ExbD
VLIKGDRRTVYESVMTAMVLLKEAGATRMGFVADPPPEVRQQP